MRYPGARGTVQAALQIRMAMAANGAMREWNPAWDKMRDSNGRMPFGEVRNAMRAKLLGPGEPAKNFRVSSPVPAHRENLIRRRIGNAAALKLEKGGIAQARIF